jgi:hypothetical protein
MQVTIRNSQLNKVVAQNDGKIILVKDDGAYIMSWDKVSNKNTVVYLANRFNPEKNEDCYDNTRDAFGGDDFGETIQLEKNLVDAAKNNKIHSMKFTITDTQISLRTTFVK